MHVSCCQKGWGGEDRAGSRGDSSTDCRCLHANLEDGVGVNGEEQSLDEGRGLETYSRASPACLWGANSFRPDVQVLTRKMLRHPEGPSQQQKLHLQTKLSDRSLQPGNVDVHISRHMYLARYG